MALAVAPVAALAETAARPSAPMVATAGSLVVQTGAGAPATGWLRASSAEAWKSGISPGGTRRAEGVTITCATTCATAMAVVASLPSAEAWMVALPVASLVLNAMPTPRIGAPPASRATAVSRTESPRLVRGAGADGVNETDATGGRDGPPPPQASRTSTANGQARRSGIHPPSAAILRGLTRRSRKGLTDGAARPYIARRSIHPLQPFAPPGGACCDPDPHKHARRAGTPETAHEPVRAQGDEDPAAGQAGEGPQHRGPRRAAQAGTHLPHPPGPEVGHADRGRGRAGGPARRLRLPPQPGFQLHAGSRRHLRVALPDPPLQPAHRRHGEGADPPAQGLGALLRAAQGRRDQLHRARRGRPKGPLRQPDR